MTIPHDPTVPGVQPDALLLRYDEIALKGANRARFERLLIRRTRARIDPESELDFQRQRGRIWAVNRNGEPLSREILRAARDGARHIFGLSSLSSGLLVEPTLEALEQAVDAIFPVLYAQAERQIAEDAPIRYAMRMRRHGTGFGMSSKDVEIHFADRLLSSHPRLKVDLTHPD
ncbi:MAG: THUMP domain-containing protein, partial [bacterium]